MSEHLLLCVAREELAAEFWPKFGRNGDGLSFALKDKRPQRLEHGSDVVVMTVWEKVYVYLGIMRNVHLHAEERVLLLERYDPFPSPIVVTDYWHGIHRPHLFGAGKSWSPGEFGYIEHEVFEAVERAAQDNTEIAIWLEVSNFLIREQKY